MLNKNWQVGGGVNLSAEKGKNNKFGMNLNTKVQRLNYITVDVRAEQNVYKESIFTTGNYNEFIFRSTISATW